MAIHNTISRRKKIIHHTPTYKPSKMGSINREIVSDHNEQLKAQAHIWNHIFSFINSMSLKCAIELGIPDVIHNHGQPMTLSVLVAALPIRPTKAHHVGRLMRMLTHSGFFATENFGREGEGEEGYVLTPSSRLLLRDNPFSVTPLLLSMLDPTSMKPWQYLSTWFQNEDSTPFGTANGLPIWAFAGREPKYGGLFDEAMASDARLVVSVLVDKCKEVFEGVRSLVDVGGGTGTVAKGIADAFPEMECTVLDLPHVVRGLEGTKNLKFVEGDMFEAIPPANAVLLKWITHDWSDEDCLKILKNCREAIARSGAKGGKLIIIDMVMESHEGDDEFVETEHLLDMLMIVLYGSKERNEKELAELFAKAGFNHYKISPIMGLRSVIEVYP